MDRKYPLPNDPRLKSILEAIYVAIEELQRRPTQLALSPSAQDALAKQAASQAAGLLGAFGQTPLGQTGVDPFVVPVGTGAGTLTNFSRVNNTSFLTVTVTNPTTTPVITFDANPANGWGTPSSTLARTTFATYAGQTVSAGYVQAEVQAIDDHTKVVSQRLGALITDLLAKGHLSS